MNGMQGEDLSAVAGVLLSVGCSYLPGVREAFDRLAPTQKRLVMLALLSISALVVFGLSCLEPGSTGVVCSRAGAWGMARIFAAAVIANQAAFEVTPRRMRK